MINSREAFEKAVAGKWPDSYTFTQFNGNKDYRDEVLQGMWVGWQASRQALECEPIGFMFPDDFERLSNTECCTEIYSVEAVHPEKGETTVKLYGCSKDA